MPVVETKNSSGGLVMNTVIFLYTTNIFIQIQKTSKTIIGKKNIMIYFTI